MLQKCLEVAAVSVLKLLANVGLKGLNGGDKSRWGILDYR